MLVAAAGLMAPPAAADDHTPAPTDPPEATTVVSLDFDDESIEPWTTSGDPTLEYVDADEGTALSITRAADYEGIQSPTGLLEPGVDYTFSMRARLPEGAEGSTDLRFVVKPAYTWVANATVGADGWTELTGTYTLPADVDPAETQVYLGSADADGPYAYLIDDLIITATETGPGEPGEPGDPVDLLFDFESGLQGWQPRGDADGDPTVEVTTDEAYAGAQSARVSDRTSQGDGLGYDVTEVFEEGVTYELSAWVKMAAGESADDLWLSLERTAGTATSFDTVGQFPEVGSQEWQQVTVTYTMPAADSAVVYFETSYNTGGAGDFLVDDVRIRSLDEPEIQDLAPLQDTLDVPLGVAIDRRETQGAAADLTTRHFNQITAENHMKVEAWYDGTTFRTHPEATALMDFARTEDLRVYGHVLVWHSQTPDWFFQDDQGAPLTTSEADQQLMRDRMREHIFAVAEALSTGGGYGLYGSEENPLVAWDVVNEVISDSGEHDDGMRRSEWYRILGEEFVDLAFEYADEAFNEVYADPSADRPVTLFINDYNTEQSGKQQRYLALVERLIARGVPIDGVGHQFHTSLSTPVSALEAALERFSGLGLQQVVTELDVTLGTPVTAANVVEQGYYYRDAFRVFRDYADQLYSVTVWGLTDPRSWRSAQEPLLFDGQLQAKPAFYGAADGELPARVQAELTFAGSVPLDDGAAASPVWERLPLHQVGDVARFQTRWESDHLTVYLEVADTTPESGDAVTFVVGDQTLTLPRDGSGEVDAVVTETDEGWVAVAHLPLDGAAQGDSVAFDLQVTDGDQVTGWNTPGELGTLTLVEPLSFTEVVEAPAAPTIDGTVDEAWALAEAVTTDTQIEGTGGATAEVRTLWSGDGATLYVLAEVTDAQLDVSGSDPWVQDSVEIFLDAGAYRNGPYRYDDTQIRINVDNVVSFGTGDETFQANRLESATSTVEGGYVVEAAISLLEDGGPGTFHGLDVQVNDATDGARTAVRTWADPTGLGYQSTARWGVAQLVEAEEEPPPPAADPQLDLDRWLVPAGRSLEVQLSGYLPGSEVEVTLEARRRTPVALGVVAVGADGSGAATLTVPRGTKVGVYEVVGSDGDLADSQRVLVTPPLPPKPPWWPFPWPW
ncbi:endo-1,4-beta-xylanase [Actinotalea sp. C106]|uniref:endo-1,4-beta-xylanase n=1 Tax=Actinotalea sp. C106 TaxID=2908644 RepID=UPI0020298957|nr:endo-1,4-beta-xylanase [Actinotalea sp. C106]